MLYKSLVVCEVAIIDARTNNISLINLIEEIQAVGFPVMVPRLCFVVNIEKEAADGADHGLFNICVRVNTKQLITQPVTANFMGRPKARLIVDISGLPITEIGTLVVELVRDGAVVLSSSIEVTLPKGPQVTQTE